MDITNIRAPGSKPVTVDVDENGAEIGFRIVSKDSKEYRDAAARVRAEAIRRQTNRKTKIDRTTEEGALQLDQLLQGNEEVLALAVVVGWFGFTQPDGNGGQVPAEFSKERVEHMFKVRPTWREKVTAALEDDTGFLTS